MPGASQDPAVPKAQVTDAVEVVSGAGQQRPFNYMAGGASVGMDSLIKQKQKQNADVAGPQTEEVMQMEDENQIYDVPRPVDSSPETDIYNVPSSASVIDTTGKAPPLPPRNPNESRAMASVTGGAEGNYGNVLKGLEAEKDALQEVQSQNAQQEGVYSTIAEIQDPKPNPNAKTESTDKGKNAESQEKGKRGRSLSDPVMSMGQKMKYGIKSLSSAIGSWGSGKSAKYDMVTGTGTVAGDSVLDTGGIKEVAAHKVEENVKAEEKVDVKAGKIQNEDHVYQEIAAVSDVSQPPPAPKSDQQQTDVAVELSRQASIESGYVSETEAQEPDLHDKTGLQGLISKSDILAAQEAGGRIRAHTDGDISAMSRDDNIMPTNALSGNNNKDAGNQITGH